MKACDFPKFAALMGQVAEVYGKDRPSVGALKVFVAALSEYAIEDIRRALSLHVRRCKFMVRPADLIEILEGTEEGRAQAAWQKVRGAQRRHGVYASVAFDDPLIHYAIEKLGGWTALSAIQSKDEPFRERDFVSWYVKGERVGIGWEGVTARLAGLHELSNRQCSAYSARLGLSETYTGTIIQVGEDDAHGPIEKTQGGSSTHKLIPPVSP